MVRGIRNKRRGFWVWFLMAVGLSGVTVGWASASDIPLSAEKPLVIIDPGHGGHDAGAAGAGGTLEKKVALEFAEILEKTLKPDYRVALTRTGDYRVSLQKRASIANQQGGACFISLHCGGFSRAGIDAWSVYAFAPTGKRHELPETADKMADSDSARLNWRQIQTKYIQASKTLAETLTVNLEKCPGISTVNSAEAPLLLLEGIDMPAVIVEAGYLTNPACESRLKDPDFLADAAEWVRCGIDGFFLEK